MTASLHIAAGMAAGIVVQEYLFPEAGLIGKIFWAFIAGVMSHVLLDIFPHQEYVLKGIGLWVLVLAEAALVIVLVLPSVARPFSWAAIPVEGQGTRSFAVGLVLFSAMVGGALPDFLEMIYEYFFRQSWLAGLSRFLHLYGHDAVPLPFEINFWGQSILTALLVLFIRAKL